MNLFGRELHGFAKVLVTLVAVFLVASGMCGMQLLLANGGMSGRTRDFLLSLGKVELAAMLLSAAGIVLVLPLWGLSAVVRRSVDSQKDNDRTNAGGDETKQDKEP